MSKQLIDLPSDYLPAPESGELPEAIPLRRMLGPGVILLGLSIGSGEFILWPKLTADFGFTIFWAAMVGVTIQFFLNMEIERYTLATGESAVTGFFRLSKKFGPIFLLCGTVPWIWPGWATGGATLLTWEIGGDVTIFAIAGLILCGVVLSVGPVVYKTVEVMQITLVAVIFVLAVTLAIMVVGEDSITAMAESVGDFGHIPDGIELPILLGALAFAGCGGTGNLAQSNYIKDKGYGMGRYIGRITSPLTGREEAISDVGVVFEDTPENLARWRLWWRRANLEHGMSFYLLCMVSLGLFCLITHALIGTGLDTGDNFEFLKAESDQIKERFGGVARHLFLWTGIAVLLTTELGTLDAVSRVVVDLLGVTFRGRSFVKSPARTYFVVLWSLILFGVLVLLCGLKNPLTLLVISACLNAFVMFLYSGLLLWLGLRVYKRPIRPGLVRIGMLILSLLFFGYFSGVMLIAKFTEYFGK